MKHYLIDSENVGDFWIPLLDLPADKAELIVFYTKNSPHMSYDSLIKLKESDRTVTFIKCYEGTNALDFQLCSELGYLIACNESDEFIVVTNDTGYDAAVKYWRRKEYSVKRIAGKDSRTGGRRRGAPVRFDVAAEVSAILHKLVKVPEHDEAQEPCAEEEKTQTPAQSLYFAEPEEDIEEAVSEEEMDFVEEESSDDYDEDGSEVTEEEKEFSEEEISGEELSEEELSEEELSEEEIPEEETSEEDNSEYEEEEPSEEEPFESEFAEEADDTGDEALADAQEAENGTADDDNRQKAQDEEVEDTDEGSASELPDEETAFQEEKSEGTAEGETHRSAEKGIPAEIDPEEITAIVNCIGMENLAELHNQLIQFYGDEGKDIYQSIKSGTLTIEKKNWDKEEKFLYYCAMIFRHSDEPAETLTEETISELSTFLLGAENKRKNLNSLRYALLKHYGKEKGRRYYFMLKPYVKALNQM